MKPVITAAFAVACISAIGLGGLAASAQSQLTGSAKQQIAEASDGDGEVNDDAQSNRADSTQFAVIHTVPTQIADIKEQADTETAESPDGDGDGEMNDDG